MPHNESRLTDLHPASQAEAAVEAGEILTLSHLGRNIAPPGSQYAVEVFFLTYRSRSGGGTNLAAKLFIPVGRPPDAGWPASIWCHGLGDPATQLRRWPLVGNDWRQTRGELAGRWAHDGIVTLTPWLPGDGPSEPTGTYSPLSLERNGQAIADAFAALQNLEREFACQTERTEAADVTPAIDPDRLILRTDCVATPLLVYFAARWQAIPAAAGLKAFVADDFQPSIAYNECYLGPYLCSLPPHAAAAMRCTWVRLIWALAVDQGWPLSQFFNETAVELLSQPLSTPVGQRDRIMGSALVPPQRSELAPVLLTAAASDLGPALTGLDIRNWLYSPEMVCLASRTSLEAFVTDPFYQKYFAKSDPFFARTITPFDPGLPLLLVTRSGVNAVNVRGLPGYTERYRHMTLPKVETLRSWGWKVRVHETGINQGTSFSGGPAQRWVFDQLARML